MKTGPEPEIDLSALPPAQERTAFFKAWSDLARDGTLLLASDRDLLPLYHHLTCEAWGTFRWEYVMSGPERWQVRLQKGNFPDPGFKPRKRDGTATGPAVNRTHSRVVDTRPIVARGGSPCEAVDQAIAGLAPDQSLVVLVPFEPVPLYAKLAKQGFVYRARQLDDDSWRVEFHLVKAETGRGHDGDPCI